MPLPRDATRKDYPITTGVLDYFPDAVAEIAKVSKAGNDQHNPGEPLHWAREKSTDHADCVARHLLERGTRDVDGMRHTAKLAWRALALLQVELETVGDTDPLRQYAPLTFKEWVHVDSRLPSNHYDACVVQESKGDETRCAYYREYRAYFNEFHGAK